jgi:hypothetical protein
VVGICGGNYYSGFVCVDPMCELGEMDPKGIPHPACRTPCGPRTVGDRVEEELRVRGSGGLLCWGVTKKSIGVAKAALSLTGLLTDC